MLALEEHAVGLFLAVITQADAGVEEADVITSHALLALVFNLVSGESSVLPAGMYTGALNSDLQVGMPGRPTGQRQLTELPPACTLLLRRLQFHVFWPSSLSKLSGQEIRGH